MLVALTSDTHGYLPEIPKGVSAVIHAGDIGIDRDPINWFRDVFYPWARQLEIPIHATFGNHDRIGESQSIPDGIPTNLRLHVDILVDLMGVPTWFSPWSMRYGTWAYMAHDTVLNEKYKLISEKTQVLVTHGPPFGVGDRVNSGERVGSSSLYERIARLPDLRLVVTGHIHEAHGVYYCHGGIPVLNVTHVDEWYNPVHPPMVIEWPPLNFRRK